MSGECKSIIVNSGLMSSIHNRYMGSAKRRQYQFCNPVIKLIFQFNCECSFLFDVNGDTIEPLYLGHPWDPKHVLNWRMAVIERGGGGNRVKEVACVYFFTAGKHYQGHEQV